MGLSNTVWEGRLTEPEEMFDSPFGSAHLRGALCANSYLCVTAHALPDAPGRADLNDQLSGE